MTKVHSMSSVVEMGKMASGCSSRRFEQGLGQSDATVEKLVVCGETLWPHSVAICNAPALSLPYQHMVQLSKPDRRVTSPLLVALRPLWATKCGQLVRCFPEACADRYKIVSQKEIREGVGVGIGLAGCERREVT